MQPHIAIRDEVDADVAVIADVTVAAFKTLAIRNHTEQFIIEALRAARTLRTLRNSSLDTGMRQNGGHSGSILKIVARMLVVSLKFRF